MGVSLLGRHHRYAPPPPPPPRRCSPCCHMAVMPQSRLDANLGDLLQVLSRSDSAADDHSQ